MKSLFFIFVLSSVVFSICAQKLDYKDLNFIYHNRFDIESCDTYLAKKNFIFYEYSDSLFVYGYSFAGNNKPTVYCMFGKTEVLYQTPFRDSYDYFKEITASLKMKLKDSGVDIDGNIFFDYYNNLWNLYLTQSKDAISGRTLYIIYLSSY